MFRTSRLFQHPLIGFSDKFQFEKRRDYDKFRQQYKKIFGDNFTFIMVLVYYWDEKIFCFSPRVNSIRGHESSLLVQRTYFRRRDYLDLKQF